MNRLSDPTCVELEDKTFGARVVVKLLQKSEELHLLLVKINLLANAARATSIERLKSLASAPFQNAAQFAHCRDDILVVQIETAGRGDLLAAVLFTRKGTHVVQLESIYIHFVPTGDAGSSYSLWRLSTYRCAQAVLEQAILGVDITVPGYGATNEADDIPVDRLVLSAYTFINAVNAELTIASASLQVQQPTLIMPSPNWHVERPVLRDYDEVAAAAAAATDSLRSFSSGSPRCDVGSDDRTSPHRLPTPPLAALRRVQPPPGAKRSQPPLPPQLTQRRNVK